MAEKLDPKKLVDFRELLIANSIQVDASGYKALWYQHLFQVCLTQTYLPGAITIRPT